MKSHNDLISIYITELYTLENKLEECIICRKDRHIIGLEYSSIKSITLMYKMFDDCQS